MIVERLIEERILLFPIQFRSEVEFMELPNQGLNFTQIIGDNKAYSGTWRVQSNGKGVLSDMQALSSQTLLSIMES